MRGAAEALVVERLVPELEADGFQVFSDPNKLIVPHFLGAYRPDVIALRADRKLAIEVADRTTASQTRLDQVAKLFHDRPDWEFRLIWINQERQADEIEPQSEAAVGLSLEEVDRLLREGHEQAGFLLAWAAFEALGRLMLADRFKRPQTPSRLIEVMAGEGVLTPDEAEFLRSLYPRRNRLVHGGLDVQISPADVERFIAIMRSALTETMH